MLFTCCYTLLFHQRIIYSKENFEDSLEESGAIAQFSSLIMTLKDARNDAAHTAIKEILPTYDAPSITKRNFEIIYRLFTVIEAELENF